MTLIFSYGVSASTTIRLAGLRSRWMMPFGVGGLQHLAELAEQPADAAGREPAVAAAAACRG